MVLIILSVTWLALGLGIGFYWGRNNKKNIKKSANLPQSTKSVLTPTAAPTIGYSQPKLFLLSQAFKSGKKTYPDPELGIQFDYPDFFEAETVNIPGSNRKYQKENNTSEIRFGKGVRFVATFYNPVPDYPTPGISYSDQSSREKICQNRMKVVVNQYENKSRLSLYDFIRTLYDWKISSDDEEVVFSHYKDSLKPVDWPKPGSFLFDGVIYEGLDKEWFFQHKDSVYKFSLYGNCGLGSEFTPEMNQIFEEMVRSIRFL
ncbi:hypothetical protein ACFLZP_00975 [Patescibacteria group bacterium]